jgi:hypothetical protein
MMRITGLFKRYKNRKKSRLGNLINIGTICIVLIAAFGLLGAGYASWNQTFSIFGSTTTGEVNVSVRNVTLESSDSNESCSFNANKVGNIVSEVEMNVVTGISPFNSVLVFTVENNGTIPVTCEGIDPSVPDSLQVQILQTPGKINVGQTAPIKVKITKGYCKDFEFSTFLKFVQAAN